MGSLSVAHTYMFDNYLQWLCCFWCRGVAIGKRGTRGAPERALQTASPARPAAGFGSA